MAYNLKILAVALILTLLDFNIANAECDRFTAEAPAVAWGSTATEASKKILNEVSDDISFYYQDKKTEKVQKILTNLNSIPSRQLLTSLQNLGSFRALSGFLTGIFMENPDLYNKYRLQENTNDVNYLLDDAFLISSVMESFLEKSQNMCLDSTTLDMYWGYFFATGDKRAVITIKTTADRGQLCKKNTKNCLSTYCKKEGCTKNDVILFASDMSAEWSLKANARHHPLVREVLEE